MGTEQSISPMKLICKCSRNRSYCNTLSHCMQLLKFRSLKENNYKAILNKMLKTDNTKMQKPKNKNMHVVKFYWERTINFHSIYFMLILCRGFFIINLALVGMFYGYA